MMLKCGSPPTPVQMELVHNYLEYSNVMLSVLVEKPDRGITVMNYYRGNGTCLIIILVNLKCS